MNNNQIMRRKQVDVASLVPSEDNKRIVGTVVHVPMPWISYADEDEDNDDDDAVDQHPGSWYVEDKSTGLRYWFSNTVAHNPYRGLGSQSCTYVFAKDDTEKQHPYQDVYGIDDNSTNPDWIGPVFWNEAQVSFLPMRMEDLLRNASGQVKMFRQEDSHRDCEVEDVRLSTEYIGMACDVAPMPGEKRMRRCVFDQMNFSHRLG